MKPRAIQLHEWLGHTNFSFLVGASHPEDMVRRAVDLGYKTLAIVDFDGVYGLARAWRALKSIRRDGHGGDLRLAFGVEFHLADDHHRPVLLQDTIAFIALDRAGYATLCRLASDAHQNGKHDPRLPDGALDAIDPRGLAAIIPMRGLIRGDAADRSRLEARVASLAQTFGDRLFLAVSRHLTPAEDRWIDDVIAMGRRHGVAILPTQDPFFHAPAQKPVSDLLHAIRRNKLIDDVMPELFPNAERCLREESVLRQRWMTLPCWPDASAASERLASLLRFDMSELRYRYPRELVPDGLSSSDYLERLVRESARARFGDVVPDSIGTTIERELALVRQLDFADYFLTVHDIVAFARSQNILCQGRGSAANSAICFLLGITSVDPTRFDLLFERFLSAERGDPPDIDVDFEHERREEVIQYIYRRFGRQRAAMVANVITYRSRGAYRAAGKALGIPESCLDDGSEALDNRRFHRESSTEALARVDTDHPRRDLWHACAERIKDFPRHMGIHSGGFIIADEPLDTLVGLEPATMPGRSVIQWSKEDIEALGFFKIDVLALGMLTAVRKSLDLIRRHTGHRLDMADIPADDAPTYQMIQRADTVGVFQIESRAQMSMLPRLKPRCFYDLVIEVAIIRPGPIQGGLINPFLRRRDGLEPVVIPDERLRPILERTLGVPLFQEQVMRIAMALGKFSAGEADELRRRLGAWSVNEDELMPWLARLESNLHANGIPEDFARSIIGQLKAFASYGFPESHAASFAHIAYVSSWLKCHHPAAFFASLLNSQPMGFYEPDTLIRTARAAGVEIRPVRVNDSRVDCALEYDQGSRGGWAIRLGFRMVRALCLDAMESTLAHRPRRGWKDLESFLRDSRLDRADVTALAAADALRDLGLERRDALWAAEAVPVASLLDSPVEVGLFEDESPWERYVTDATHTGTSFGDHPTTIIMKSAWPYEIPIRSITRSDRLTSLTPGTPVTVFGMVRVRQAPPDAKGMSFFTIEDEAGLINLILTPDFYERHAEELDRAAFLCVSAPYEPRGLKTTSLFPRR